MFGWWRVRNWFTGREALRDTHRAKRAADRFPTVRDTRQHGLASELVVSFTSYGARFPTLALTAKTLLDQTVRADQTVLWIAHDDEALLPADVLELQGHGLTIRTCADLRSYKKIVPALLAYPDATIVTADDDVYYGPTWLEQLVQLAEREGGAIIVHRAHLARVDDDGRLSRYLDWEMETSRTTSEFPHLLFPTGCGGALYPPRSLSALATDSDLFLRLAPDADDVWLFWMARLAQTPIRRVAGDFKLIYWEGSQKVGLYHANMLGGNNDRQIAKMHAHFGLSCINVDPSRTAPKPQ